MGRNFFLVRGMRRPPTPAIVFLLCALVALVACNGPSVRESAEEVLVRIQQNIQDVSALRPGSASNPTTLSNLDTPQGPLIGAEQYGYRVFRGIPYAQAPVGDLRWEAPKPASGWSEPRHALRFSDACPQRSFNGSSDASPFLNVSMSEDCLYLNVWAPLQSQVEGKKVPVMVWFHGGAFVSGWGGDGLFHGDYIVNSTSDTIVVTTNYRLGPLGWITNPDLQGNFGFLDQQMALQWVQDNIAAFGGDPSRVTIFGQSAGGMSVSLHTLAPGSAHLFSRAIVESNPVGVNYRTPEESYVYTQVLGNLVNCSYTDTACLRAVSWEDLIDAEVLGYAATRLPLRTTEFLPYSPVIDGTIIPQQPMDAYRSGKVNSQIEAIAMGVVRNETLAFLPDLPLFQVTYKAMLDIVFGQNSSVVMQQYPDQRGSNMNQFSILSTDWLFECATRFAASAYVGSNIPTYTYQFMHAPTDDPINNNKPLCGNAACHSCEIPYVYNSVDFVMRGQFTTAERKLAWATLTYWRNFAHGDVDANQFGPAWPAFNSSLVSLDLNVPQVNTMQNYHYEQCEFWDYMGYYI